MKQVKLKIFFYIGILVLLFPKPAQAYLDPGTGSYFFQILISGLLGTLFFFKTFLKKIKNFFSSKTKKKALEENEDR